MRTGIIDLQRKFVEMDTDNSKALDRDEFRAAMRANRLTFSDAQLDTLFQFFGERCHWFSCYFRSVLTLLLLLVDTDKSGTIDYVELLNGLRVSYTVFMSVRGMLTFCLQRLFSL